MQSHAASGTGSMLQLWCWGLALGHTLCASQAPHPHMVARCLYTLWCLIGTPAGTCPIDLSKISGLELPSLPIDVRARLVCNKMCAEFAAQPPCLEPASTPFPPQVWGVICAQTAISILTLRTQTPSPVIPQVKRCAAQILIVSDECPAPGLQATRNASNRH